MVVHPASHRIPRVRWYSGSSPAAAPCPDGAFTLCGAAFQSASGRWQACAVGVQHHPPAGPPTPQEQRDAAHSAPGVWAPPPSLAATWGMLSVPRGTEMFHFPRFPPRALCIQARVRWHDPSRVAPFGHRRITACWPLPGAYRRWPRPSSARRA
jgi:hypothetical protein